MPTVLRIRGCQLYSWSREPNEPLRVHVDRTGASAKVWLQPVALAGNADMRPAGWASSWRWCGSSKPSCWRRGMRSSARAEGADIRVHDVRVGADELTVALMDGRTIGVPLAWYPRLLAGTPVQRACWKLADAGYGIHWPELDEDLSTEGLLAGARAPRGSGGWCSRLLGGTAA